MCFQSKDRAAVSEKRPRKSFRNLQGGKAICERAIKAA
ncbi:hypothetical protein T11_18286 [Trichinella zimbabwensis]|uniref:Uncharacterized protein n=1 Tax=Trichinella zimbabwensis TaxID=268475 RepID=A0A0V1GKN5_9BILA|nr:hypothetical protein T11_18286 [Trichinella zimbabwensis]